MNLDEKKIIEEKILEFYNTNINKDAPVTLEWLKRQRIITERYKIANRFGKEEIESILGKPSYLAQAQEMLRRVNFFKKYELIPNIARMLAAECMNTLNYESSIRKKYSSLSEHISIPIFNLPNNELFYFSELITTEKFLSLHQLETIFNYPYVEEIDKNPYMLYYFEYLQKATLHVLELAFDEIKKEVESITK